MAESPAALDRAFHALSDPTRRAILSLVRDAPRAVGQIAEAVGASQQATSHHLGVLRAAALVTSSRQGTRQLYAIRSDGLASSRAYLEDFWPQRLQALKRAAEAVSGATGTPSSGGVRSDVTDRPGSAGGSPGGHDG